MRLMCKYCVVDQHELCLIVCHVLYGLWGYVLLLLSLHRMYSTLGITHTSISALCHMSRVRTDFHLSRTLSVGIFRSAVVKSRIFEKDQCELRPRPVLIVTNATAWHTFINNYRRILSILHWNTVASV